MHFFKPPGDHEAWWRSCPGRRTSPETLAAAAEAFARQLGKDPVVCKTEAPAGIVSRTLGQMLKRSHLAGGLGGGRPGRRGQRP